MQCGRSWILERGPSSQNCRNALNCRIVGRRRSIVGLEGDGRAGEDANGTPHKAVPRVEEDWGCLVDIRQSAARQVSADEGERTAATAMEGDEVALCTSYSNPSSPSPFPVSRTTRDGRGTLDVDQAS